MEAVSSDMDRFLDRGLAGLCHTKMLPFYLQPFGYSLTLLLIEVPQVSTLCPLPVPSELCGNQMRCDCKLFRIGLSKDQSP